MLWKQSPGRYIAPVNDAPSVSESPPGLRSRIKALSLNAPSERESPLRRKQKREAALPSVHCSGRSVSGDFRGLYFGLFKGAPDLTTNSVTQAPALTGSTQQGSIAADGEIVPPVGRGQHFTLGNVRYCHFQEERLKIMKPDVRGPEAMRAFNLLVVDYNSRCSDFLYQDSDVAAVKAELKAKRPLLEADAKRIMASWSPRVLPIPPCCQNRTTAPQTPPGSPIGL